MPRQGLFDTTAVPAGLFDKNGQDQGWFDRDLLYFPVGPPPPPPPGPTPVPQPLAGGGGGGGGGYVREECPPVQEWIPPEVRYEPIEVWKETVEELVVEDEGEIFDELSIEDELLGYAVMPIGIGIVRALADGELRFVRDANGYRFATIVTPDGKKIAYALGLSGKSIGLPRSVTAGEPIARVVEEISRFQESKTIEHVLAPPATETAVSTLASAKPLVRLTLSPTTLTSPAFPFLGYIVVAGFVGLAIGVGIGLAAASKKPKRKRKRKKRKSKKIAS